MGTVRELDGNTFDEVISADGVVVVDFWAPWCGPCRAFAPIFAAAAGENPDAVFAKLDTSTNPHIAASVGVRSIPTVMVFRDGVLVAEHVGVMSGAALTDAVRAAATLDVGAYLESLDDGATFPDGAVV